MPQYLSRYFLSFSKDPDWAGVAWLWSVSVTCWRRCQPAFILTACSCQGSSNTACSPPLSGEPGSCFPLFPSGVLIWRAFHTILSPLPQTTVSLHYFWLLIKHLLLLRARWYQYAMDPGHVCLCLCCHPKPARQPLMNSSVTMETVLSQLFQLAGISLAWLFLASSNY